jgi:hypothetical protein
MSAPLNSKTARELLEAYQSIYMTEEVENITEEPYKRGPWGREFSGINRSTSNLMTSGGIGGAISRGFQSAQSGARRALGLEPSVNVKPGEKYGPGDGPSAASKGTIGGLLKKTPPAATTQQPVQQKTQQPVQQKTQQPVQQKTQQPVQQKTQQPSGKPATAGTYSSQFKKSAPALSKTLTKKEPTMKSDLGGRLGKALSGKVSDFQFKDSYDMVLDYLLSEGHVASVEEAHYVMLEMDQETIQGICERYEDVMEADKKEKKDKKIKELIDRAGTGNPRYDERRAGSSRVKGFKFTTTEEVEAVDEGLTGERYKAALKKGKMYSRKVSEDPKKRATRGGRGGESDFGAGDRGAGNKAARRAGTYQEEEFELWVNGLIEEGYDLSDYTWDEMYEFYLEEGRTTNLRALAGESERRKADRERGRPETQDEKHRRLAMGRYSPSQYKWKKVDGQWKNMGRKDGEKD